MDIFFARLRYLKCAPQTPKNHKAHLPIPCLPKCISGNLTLPPRRGEQDLVMKMAAGARKLLFCFLAAGVLYTANAALPKQGDSTDWMQELRSVPKPTIDPNTNAKTFIKHFVRSNPETGEYTHLAYNCTVAQDQYVNLDDARFGVTNVECKDNKVQITTATHEGLEELGHALAHSRTGLLFGGQDRICLDVRGRQPGHIYR
jgi:hypothetical protein